MGPSQKRSQSPSATECQPRAAQPSAELPKGGGYTLSDLEIVVLSQKTYWHMEARGPFKSIAGPLWGTFWTAAGKSVSSLSAPPGMWGAGFIDPSVDGDSKHVYRAGITTTDDAVIELPDEVVKGTLLCEEGTNCRYCKFVMSGDYDNFSAAYADCLAQVAKSGFLHRAKAWCLEEYLNTPMDTPNPADLRTAIYIPVDENPDLYTVSGPTVVTLRHDTFVHLEGEGEFSTIAPALWGSFHGEHTKTLPMDLMTGMWSGSLVRDNGQHLYRPGATFNCTHTELLSKVSGGALLPGSALGSIGDGKTYAKFELTAPFSSLGAAFGDCLDRVAAAKSTMKRRADDFNWETYLSDPADTKPTENRIDIYIAVDVVTNSTA